MYYNMQKETYEDKIMRELTDEKLSEIIKKTDNNTMIAHYTTMEGFVGLLNSVDVSNGEPMLKMWASNIFALNDPSEFMHGYKYTRDGFLRLNRNLMLVMKINCQGYGGRVHMRKNLILIITSC